MVAQFIHLHEFGENLLIAFSGELWAPWDVSSNLSPALSPGFFI